MAYKVTEIQGETQTDGHGNVSAFVSLEGVDGGVLLRKRPPFPSVGDVLDAAYEIQDVPKKSGDGTYKKLVKPSPNGGGGGSWGPRPEDPDRAKRIVRQHSQEMALLYMRAKGISDFRLDDDFRKVISWFEQDAGQ